MKKQQLIIETRHCLHKLAPNLEFFWLNKLKEPELAELHELLLDVLEPDDLIQF